MEDMADKWLKTPLNKPDALKNPMKNPQKQMQRNLFCFRRLITDSNFAEIPVRGVVVFPRNSCLLINRDQNFDIPVLYHDELIDYLTEIDSHTYFKYFCKNGDELISELQNLVN